jgi:hypothetical protein
MSTVDDADQEITEEAAPYRPPRALLVASSLGMVLALVVLSVLLLWLVRNDPSLLRKSLGPLLMSMLFLLLGFSTIGLMKAFIPDFTVHGDVLFITVLVVPIIAYLLLAGQVSSLSVSGVLEANFLQEDLNQLLPPSVSLSQELLTNLEPVSSGTDPQDGTEAEADACAARTPTPTVVSSSGAPLPRGTPTVVPVATTVPYVNPVYRQTIQNPPPAGAPAAEATQAPMDMVVAGKSVYLPLEVGQRYEPEALSTQVARLAQSDAFKFVVFVINCRFLVADIPAAAAPEVFRQQAEALVTAIEDGPGALRDPGQFPALGYDTIHATDSAQMALDTMSERNIDALIEIDGSGNIVKVITREQIESALIQELVTRTAQ